MIAYEDGPGAVFDTIRRTFGQSAFGQPKGSLAWSLAELVNCRYCAGVWIALLMAALVLWPTKPGDLILLAFGVAGGQTIITEYLDGCHG